MIHAVPNLDEKYWQNLTIQKADLEALSAHLLEVETPLSPQELVAYLINLRIDQETEAQSALQSAAGDLYLPKDTHRASQRLLFPVLANINGEVIAIREGDTVSGINFKVIEVEFDDGTKREFASGLTDHALNEAPEQTEESPESQIEKIVETAGSELITKLEHELDSSEDFIYIAGRWFHEALTVDVTEGQLNVAEALLDMASGGPLSTGELLGDVDLPDGINPKLAAFSLDFALQEDERFDEVGPAGKVGWFLHRLEPSDVQKTPLFLRYLSDEQQQFSLNDDMLSLEFRLDDEHSQQHSPTEETAVDLVEARLIFPHWRAGTLPLTEKMARLFPTAYESPRVKFDFVDGESGEHFPGWVVRFERYIYGLRDWYEQRGLMPGAYVRARKGDNPGEIIVETDAHRSSKEWVRTALVGSEGGVVYAMLKQTVETSFDERMMVYLPGELSALDEAWHSSAEAPLDLQKLVYKLVGELAQLSPQNHAHATEIYAAVNVLKRCPPAPILDLLENSGNFEHVGHLHYRLAKENEHDGN
jgi:hypothetical protein